MFLNSESNSRYLGMSKLHFLKKRISQIIIRFSTFHSPTELHLPAYIINFKRCFVNDKNENNRLKP